MNPIFENNTNFLFEIIEIENFLKSATLNFKLIPIGIQ